MLKLLNRADPQTVEFAIHFDPETQLPLDEPREGSETVTFWLRPLSAAEMTRSLDRSISMDRKGRERKSLTRMSRQLILSAVVRVDGLSDVNGEPVTRLTDAYYDSLPAWVTVRLSAEMERINGLSEDESGN